MKRTIPAIIVACFVVMVTAGFAFASQSVSVSGDLPYFHIGCLIMGGLTISSLKYRYRDLYLSEALGSFALYAVFVSLFTAPVFEAIQRVLS